MNVTKIFLSKEIVKKALIEHIEEKISKLKDPKHFTKFDSTNDFFIGACGEYAIAKYFYERGYKKGIDYFQMSKYKQDKNFQNDFTIINNKIYDKYDFKLKLFKNEEEIKIDVKTQKYIGNFTEDWQFGVNSNTIKQLEENPTKINYLLFVFVKKGVEDFINLENKTIEYLEDILLNIDQKIIFSDIICEILGLIEPYDFINNATLFKKDEIYRINKNYKTGKLNTFSSFTDMYRINLSYLKNINKIFPKKIINEKNIDLDFLNEYIKINTINNNFNKFVEICINANIINFPYNKIYLNSQFKDFEEFINQAIMTQNQNKKII